MNAFKWAAGGFGAALGVVVGLRADGYDLSLSVGILIGMVAMLPLAGGTLLTLAAYHGRRERIIGSRSRPASPGRFSGASAVTAPMQVAAGTRVEGQRSRPAQALHHRDGRARAPSRSRSRVDSHPLKPRRTHGA